MDHLINWLEIPVTNMQRAKAFYGAVFDVDFADMDLAGNGYALFAVEHRRNAGALVCGDGAVPSMTGTFAYLDGMNRIDELLDRVVAAGGEVLLPKTRLSDEAGDIGIFRDTEGNRVGLQSTPRSEIIDDSTMQRLLGSAPHRFTFVLHRGPAYGPATDALQWEHARNMFTLLQRGVLRSVTALLDGDDVLGVGTLDAASKADVEALLAADPAVRGGRLIARVSTAAVFNRDDF